MSSVERDETLPGNSIVKKRPVRNLVASVHQRLLNKAAQAGEDAQYVLIRYGLERLLYRLSRSKHAEQFVMKGAMLFLVWTGETYRPTKDVDLLAIQSASRAQFKKIFQDICGVAVVEDGLVFLSETVRAEDIREEETYHGVRVTLEGRLGKAKIPLQIDIGLGDAITPSPQQANFPTLLDFPSPRLTMYPKETVVAEKFETMARRGIASSRMRDYYDVYALSQEFEFDGEILSDAIRATCKRRRTDIGSDVPYALTSDFATDALKQRQWQAFQRRGRLKLRVNDLKNVVSTIRDFLMPAVQAVREGRAFKSHWSKGGQWR